MPERCSITHVDAFTSHVSVSIFQSAGLPDPEDLLEGKEKHRRYAKLRPDVEVDADALSIVIDAAYSDVRARFVAG